MSLKDGNVMIEIDPILVRISTYKRVVNFKYCGGVLLVGISYQSLHSQAHLHAGLAFQKKENDCTCDRTM